MNIEDAREMFEHLAENIQLRFLRRAGKRAAELIRDEASRNAPKRTGALANNMTIKTKKESDTSIHVMVGPSKGEFYGRFVEKGTVKMSADPFLMPAIEEKGDEAAAVFANELIKEIEKAFKKGLISVP